MAQKISAAQNVSYETMRLLELMAGELVAIRTAHTALLAKLDGDAGITDTDYEATVEIAAAQIEV